MSYMLCNYFFLNSGGLLGEVILNVVGFFFVFFQIGVYSEIFFENLGLLICFIFYGNEILKKISKFVMIIFVKKENI